jgi:hypothetical protein
MATHIEDCCHDYSILTSDPAHWGQNSEPATGLHYTQEKLLSVKPVKEENFTEKISSSVTIEKQPSITIMDEKLEDVKPDQSQGIKRNELEGDGTDNDLDEVVPEKEKKKKKKSSGKNKNKQDVPNGFEGKPPRPAILLRYTNIAL